MQFRSSFILRSLLLILLLPWLLIYLFNLFWGGFGFAMILFDPGTSVGGPDPHMYGTDDLGGQFGATDFPSTPDTQPWYGQIPVSLFFICYFGFVGLFVRSFLPKGIRFIENIFYRPDEEYRFPRSVRRTCGAIAMVFFPALFLFCPFLGPFFWLTVPFLNDGFPLPGTVVYFLCLTVLLIAPFWIYRRPKNGSPQKTLVEPVVVANEIPD